MRLAWFTPWSPQRSGVAGRSAEIVPLLAARGFAVDVFVDERLVPVLRSGDEAPEPGQIRVLGAHDFVWREARRQYDLAVYQVGNSRAHEFLWPYLVRWPGLTVLHDARLHHARGRARLQARDPEAYRREFAWNHPDSSPEAAELAVRGFDGAYYYLWPMVRAVVERSRLVAVHARGAESELREAWPDARLTYLPLGEGPDRQISDRERAAARRVLGFADDDVVFGVFGGLTPEKRPAEIFRAFDRTARRDPRARLLVAGPPEATSDWRQLAQTIGILDRTTFAGELDDARFDQAIGAVDVSMHLRWPSALETSGPWLRALAQGRATIVTDLVHQSDVPVLDPRTWNASGGQPDPIAVAIDILDEDHSLALAMRRLAADADLRARLGAAGRAYWSREHSVARMLDGYLAALSYAATAPAPPAALPDALRGETAGDSVRSLINGIDGVTCELF